MRRRTEQNQPRLARVLVISAGFSYEHGGKDLGVVRELSRRGYHVKHVLVGRAVVPGYPKGWASRAEFAAVGSLWRDRLVSLIPLLVWADVLLVPNARGVTAIVQWARRIGRTVVQHDNLGGFDCYYYGADYVALKGRYFKEMVEHCGGEAVAAGGTVVPDFLRPGLSAMHSLPQDRVVVTGSVQYDQAFSPEVTSASREQFCALYGLDPAKRIAVWLPDGAQNQDEWAQMKYVEICRAVEQSNNHSLVIKLHPNDFLGHKADRFLGGRRSSDVLFPRGKVCRPEHKYLCFRSCDVGLTVLSSVALEFPLFMKPVVFVDSEESPIVKGYGHFFKRGIPFPGVVGSYCTASALACFLSGYRYEVSDEGVYRDQVARFSLRADGRAYLRVADLVERAATEGPVRPIDLRSVAAMARHAIGRSAYALTNRLQAVRNARDRMAAVARGEHGE